MAIFNSYVSLPEGRMQIRSQGQMGVDEFPLSIGLARRHLRSQVDQR